MKIVPKWWLYLDWQLRPSKKCLPTFCMGCALVIVHDSSHSTQPAPRVTVCPLTPVASKIEGRPCGDLSHSPSCWLRTFGRQSNTLTCWAAHRKKKEKKKGDALHLFSWRRCDEVFAHSQWLQSGLNVVISLRLSLLRNFCITVSLVWWVSLTNSIFTTMFVLSVRKERALIWAEQTVLSKLVVFLTTETKGHCG